MAQDLDQSPAVPYNIETTGPTIGPVKNFNPGGGGGTPGGSPGQVQVNVANTSFGGLTNVQLTALIQPFSTGLSGAAPASGGGTSNFLRADGTWQPPPSGSIPDGNKGDITTSGGGTTWTINNLAVTYAKMQNISANSRVLGNVSGAAGPVTELTPTQLTTLVNTFSTSTTTSGAVVGSNNLNLTTAFLRADGTWQIPPGGGTGAPPGGATNTVQYNAGGGIFGGMSGTAWDDTNRALSATGATVTTSKPWNWTQTWNAAVTFDFELINITDSNSNANSTLIRRQVGGSDKFVVRKDGTIVTATWGGTPVGVAFGGTGLTSYTTGDLIVANGATSLVQLNDVATGNALISGGVGAAPSYGKIGLSTHVSGNLPVTNLAGGSGANSTTFWRGDGTWAAATFNKNQIPNVMDFGAVRTNSANSTDMTNTYNAFVNAWAAAPRGLIYAPAGYYRINNTGWTVPNINGAGLLGDGGTCGSTVIVATNNTGDIIVNQAGQFNFQGFAILRDLSSGTTVRGVLSAVSGVGLNVGNTTTQGYIHDIWLRNHNVGLKLAGTGYSRASHIQTEFNSGDGYQCIDTSGLNPLQWALDEIISQNNLGKGFNIDGGGTHAVPCETMTRLATFNNNDVGFSANGLASVRLDNCFFGGDGGPEEVLLSGAGSSIYPHILTNVNVELAGNTILPTNTTQARGFLFDSTLTCDVSMVNCYSVGATLSGVVHNANTNLMIHGGGFNNNGTSAIGGNNDGVLVLQGTASIMGAVAKSNNGFGFVAAGAVTNFVILGCKGTINSASPSTYNPVGANY